LNETSIGLSSPAPGRNLSGITAKSEETPYDGQMLRHRHNASLLDGELAAEMTEDGGATRLSVRRLRPLVLQSEEESALAFSRLNAN
jgi:hypothetical protein